MHAGARVGIVLSPGWNWPRFYHSVLSWLHSVIVSSLHCPGFLVALADFDACLQTVDTPAA